MVESLTDERNICFSGVDAECLQSFFIFGQASQVKANIMKAIPCDTRHVVNTRVSSDAITVQPLCLLCQ